MARLEVLRQVDDSGGLTVRSQPTTQVLPGPVGEDPLLPPGCVAPLAQFVAHSRTLVPDWYGVREWAEECADLEGDGTMVGTDGAHSPVGFWYRHGGGHWALVGAVAFFTAPTLRLTYQLWRRRKNVYCCRRRRTASAPALVSTSTKRAPQYI